MACQCDGPGWAYLLQEVPQALGRHGHEGLVALGGHPAYHEELLHEAVEPVAVPGDPHLRGDLYHPVVVRVDPDPEASLFVEGCAEGLEEADLNYVGASTFMGVGEPAHAGVVEAPVQEGLLGILPPPLGVPPDRGVAHHLGWYGLQGGFDEDEVQHTCGT